MEGRIDATPFRATLMPVRGGGHRLYVNGGMRAATGVTAGDHVTITVRPTNPDEATAPEEIEAALDAAGTAGTFEALAPSHRREWLRYVDDARSPSARTKRITRMVQALAGQPEHRQHDHGALVRELWTCPRCGNQFVNRNQNHSCATSSVEVVFAAVPAPIRDLYDRIVELVERNGPVEVVAYRDRVAFMVRVRFAGVTPKKRWLDLELWLPEHVDSPRWHKVELLTPNATIHVLRVTDSSQLDAEVAGWLAGAYAVGCQHHLAGSAGADPHRSERRG